MTHRGVAVKVERPGGLQDPVKLHEARCHVHEVGHRIVLPKQGAEGDQCVGDRVGQNLLILGELLICEMRPVPRVLESLNLR